MAARSFLGAGDIYIESIVNGVGAGLAGPFYANKLAIKPTIDTKQSASKGRYDYGATLESVALPQPAELTLELKEIVGDVFAMALMGSAAAITQTAGTLTDDPIVAKKGFWVAASKQRLGATGVTLENSSGTVTYVEGTDYVLNRPMGLVKILPDSAIAELAALKLSGPYLAYSGTKVSGATQSEIRVRIVLDGVNRADNSEVTAEIYEAVLSTSSEFDFLPDDFGVVTLTGSAKTPAGRTAPFDVYLKT